MQVQSWALPQLTPLFIERQLQESMGPFLGCGIIFEEMVRNPQSEDQVRHLDGLFKLNPLMQARSPRSSKWKDFSQEYLKGKQCAACGGTYRLVAHHMIPFHVEPALELDENNLIPLCEGRISCNCHLTFGHLGNWTLCNGDVDYMADQYLKRFMGARSMRF